MGFVVRNVRGTSGRRCGCGTWVDHWYYEARSTRTMCGARGCGSDVVVGAHVVIVDGTPSLAQFIVPVCHPCNMRRDDFELKSDVVAVSANTQVMACYRRQA